VSALVLKLAKSKTVDPGSPRALLAGVVDGRGARFLVALIVVAQLIALVGLIVAALMIGRMLQDVVTEHRYGDIWRLALVFGVAFGGRLAMLRVIDYIAVRLGVDYAERTISQVTERATRAPLGGTELGYLVTDGVATLIPYAARFLPEVIGAAIATPVLILFTLLESPMAFIEVVVGLMVLPVIMIVVGKSTKDRADLQLGATVRLNALYLDILSGMVTLKAFNKAHLQEHAIANAAQELRKRTMGVLSIAFISGVSLDTLVAIIVALVAVSIGIRLNDASMTLATGAAVLFVIPEIFRPVRAAALQFHATQDAAAVHRRIAHLVDGHDEPECIMASMTPSIVSTTLTRQAPQTVGASNHDDRGLALELEDFGVLIPNGQRSAGVNLAAAWGDLIVVRGASGVGKTSWLLGLGGLLPTVGRLKLQPRRSDTSGVGFEDLGVHAGQWRSALPRELVAFLPANPGFVEASVYDNLILLNPSANRSQVRDVLAMVGADGFEDRLDQRVLANGVNLSAGERQRLGVARVLLMRRPILLLDEPTAHLNSAMERKLLDSLLAVSASRLLVIASHSDRIQSEASWLLKLGETR
jgi:ABC-type transport system involved in cytochrome bd biosynthesis fused ATPase/permease subunit